MEKVLGYDFDNKTGKLNINEAESKIVKATFDLASEYKLNEDEIFNLLTKDLSLDQIINFRIFKIQNTLLYEYNKRVDFGNILEIIINNDNIAKNLINPLLDIKNTMQEEYEINQIDSLLDKIDDVIKLLKNKNNILDKYNNFKETSEIVRKMNDIKKDAYKIVSNHEPIIDRDLWKHASQIVDDKNLEEIDK